KELEKKQEEKSRKIGNSSIKSRLVQTGLPLRMSQFYIMSAVLGIVVLLVTVLAGAPPLLAIGAGFAAAIGMPRWILSFLVKRRQKRFLVEFPNALDVMVRSI